MFKKNQKSGLEVSKFSCQDTENDLISSEKYLRIHYQTI